MRTRSMAVATMTLVLWGCDGGSATENEAPCCSELQADAPLPDTSLYRLESSWKDRTGRLRTLAGFRGETTVVAMIFTHCAFACPQTLSDLKSIRTELSQGARDTTRFLLVSLDADRDTPDVLAAWANDNALSASSWTLLHGEAPDVRELAAVLGVKFKRQPNGDFSHSNLITVLDRDGSVAHRQTGLNAPIGATVARIESLSR